MDLAQAYPNLRAVLPSADEDSIDAFLEGKTPYIPNLSARHALTLPLEEVLSLLRDKLGGDLLRLAMKRKYRFPSPVYRETDGSWLDPDDLRVIDLEKLDSIWQLPGLLLTREYSQRSFLLTGLWDYEQVNGQKGLLSWKLSEKLFCDEVLQAYPKLRNPNRQLSVMLNLMHALGRCIGFNLPEAISPNSELVLGNPHLFGWQKPSSREPELRSAARVKGLILDWLWQQNGHNTTKIPEDPGRFFSARVPEKRRLKLLFGKADDEEDQNRRRKHLQRRITQYGFTPSNKSSSLTYCSAKIDNFLRQFPFDFLQIPVHQARGENLSFLPSTKVNTILKAVREGSPFFGVL